MRLDFDHFLVERWHDKDGWLLDAATSDIEDARKSLRQLSVGGHKARITKLVELAEKGEAV